MTTNAFDQPIGPALPDFTPPARLEATTLEGRFATLTPLDIEAHGGALFEGLGRKEHASQWTYMMAAPEAFTREAFEAYLRKKTADPDHVAFTVLHNQSNTPAGLCALIRHRPQHASVEIGHVIFDPSHQRTALTTETIYLLLGYAFDSGYRRVEWKCDALNERSVRAARRLGFTFEGVFRNDIVYKGRSRDTAWFSITDGEWVRIKTAFVAWLEPGNFDASGVAISGLRLPATDSSA